MIYSTTHHRTGVCYQRMLKGQRGYLSVIAILLIMMVGFLGSTLSYLFTDTNNATLNSFLANRAYYVAQAGTEQASRYVLAKGVACGSVTGNSDLTNTSFGGGQFTVTGAANVANTTLSGSITAAGTSITLASTAGFATEGVISVDSEVISYTGLSGNNLLGVARGVFTTTAASHTSGAQVSQNQCTLDSVAGVPNLSSSLAKSEIVKIIPLFTSLGGSTAWAVGDVIGGQVTAAQLNGTAWTASPISATVSIAAYGVAVPSASNVAITVDRNKFLNGNGSTWTLVSLTPASVTNYGVSCGALTDCHTVGDRSGNQPGLTDWTSAGGWVRASSFGGSVGRSNLKSVSCTSATNCWAVGDNADSGIFYRWTGSWTGHTVSSLSGFTYYGVFCNSTSDCWAVGSNATFARYNGSTWSNFSTGLPSARYNSVFCVAPNDCWAVGNVNAGRDLIVRWNGSSWTRDSSNPTPIANLKGVACLSANNCWAVGASTVGNNPIFVQYNGSSWQNVSVSGMPSGASLNALAVNNSGGGVSIPSNSAIVIQEFA